MFDEWNAVEVRRRRRRRRRRGTGCFDVRRTVDRLYVQRSWCFNVRWRRPKRGVQSKACSVGMHKRSRHCATLTCAEVLRSADMIAEAAAAWKRQLVILWSGFEKMKEAACRYCITGLLSRTVLVQCSRLYSAPSTIAIVLHHSLLCAFMFNSVSCSSFNASSVKACMLTIRSRMPVMTVRAIGGPSSRTMARQVIPLDKDG